MKWNIHKTATDIIIFITVSNCQWSMYLILRKLTILFYKTRVKNKLHQQNNYMKNNFYNI